MNIQDFEFVADLVKARSGVALASDKSYLLEGRLGPLARREGLAAIEDLVQVMRARKEERLITQLVDVMTSSETSFFRDRAQFQYLRDELLPTLARARRGSRIRVWCAGCATGQEAYSIAMILDQNPELTGGVPVEIVATDMSDRCIERARHGLFTQFEVQRGLPIRYLMQYFTQNDEQWRISESLRSRVSFMKQNLLAPSQELGKFDVVLCRNVVSAFEPALRKDVLNRLSLQISADGHLMLGAQETLDQAGGDIRAVKDCRGMFQFSAAAVQAA